MEAVTRVPLLQSPATMKKVAMQLGVRGGGERRSLVMTTPPASTQKREARIRKSDTTANMTHSSCGHEIRSIEGVNFTCFCEGSFYAFYEGAILYFCEGAHFMYFCEGHHFTCLCEEVILRIFLWWGSFYMFYYLEQVSLLIELIMFFWLIKLQKTCTFKFCRFLLNFRLQINSTQL